MISPPLAPRGPRQSLATLASLLALAVILLGSISDASALTGETGEHTVTGSKSKKTMGRQSWPSAPSAHRNRGLSSRGSRANHRLVEELSATTVARNHVPTDAKTVSAKTVKAKIVNGVKTTLVALVLAAILPGSVAAKDQSWRWPPAAGAEDYLIECKPDGGEWTTMDRVRGTTTRIYGYRDDIGYTCGAKGCNGAGCAARSPTARIEPTTSSSPASTGTSTTSENTPTITAIKDLPPGIIIRGLGWD